LIKLKKKQVGRNLSFASFANYHNQQQRVFVLAPVAERLPLKSGLELTQTITFTHGHQP